MEKTSPLAVEHDTSAFFSFANHPVKFRFYLLKNLPAAFFSGVRLISANNKRSEVSVPYKHFTRNPFRSTYFACLSMAAELSTGILAMANVYQRKPTVSMLITGMEARFYKKAKGLTRFICSDGEIISDVVAAATNDQQSHEVKAHSVGKNGAGELVAEFWFTWSFKAK